MCEYQIEQQDFDLDRKLLHHVLTNLLFNAGKYSPQGKVIDFIVTPSKSESIFKICDREIGIPARDLPQIFDSFYRASNCENFPGSALGLAIAKQYIELHQGIIAVESELNIGTTFTVTIPDGRFEDMPDIDDNNILFNPDRV